MSGVVKKLDETVINRMAAGEVLQRPASALKEILENSLDAKSTNIQITLKAGGLKFLQVQDNGTGIRRENLEIVCERFTTSKLEKYDDLNKIATYGFRGEALASISHVAHLTILTKTDDDKCAYRACYEDGVLKNPIKPCAGNRGTQITVEDLFYNVTARKKALRSPAEEYQKIFEIVGNYAVHNHNVAFSLKKYGENTDLKTPCNSNSVDNIRIIFGNAIARELMNVTISDDNLKLKMNGLVSNVNYSNKKGTLLLFINHRLVESSNLKKAIEAVYATYLPKNGHPFAYLSIELDPQNVDVNVHPTKHEVHFLYEEQIIEKITKSIESVLLKCSTSRVMYTQALLPGAKIPDLNEVLNTTSQKSLPPQHFVRTDSTVQKLDKFFGNQTKECENIVTIKNDFSTEETKCIEEEKPSSSSSFNITTMANVPQHSVFIDPKESFKTRQFSTERNETKLTSVLKLRLKIEKNCSHSLREILANLVFIGFVDLKRTIIQHSTKMYLCNTTRLM